MPAAAPQATSSRRLGTGALPRIATLEPISADSCTMGPSRPIDPPDAIVRSEETLRINVGRAEITPSPTATASM